MCIEKTLVRRSTERSGNRYGRRESEKKKGRRKERKREGKRKKKTSHDSTLTPSVPLAAASVLNEHTSRIQQGAGLGILLIADWLHSVIYTDK